MNNQTPHTDDSPNAQRIRADTPTAPINTDFMQTKTCANVFTNIATIFLAQIPLGVLANAIPTAFRPAYQVVIGLTILILILLQTRKLKQLSENVTTICLVQYGLLIFSPAHAIANHFTLRNSLPNRLITIMLAILGILFIWKLFGLIMDMALTAKRMSIYTSARRLRLVDALSPLIIIAIFLIVGLIFTILGLPTKFTNPPGYIMFLIILLGLTIFAALLVLAILNIRLLLNTAKMCREFSTTKNEATPPETQNA